jgi:protein AaeX
MRFAEVNLLGVYVAPIAVMMIVAWLVMVPLRLAATRLGLLRFFWHPALVVFAFYAAVLSVIVLLAGRAGG